MVLKYVIAGTSPLSGWTDLPEVLLKNAVKAKWTTDVLDPPVAYVNFNNDWFTDSSDLEFTFKFLREEPKDKSIGWNRYNFATFIDVHMWIRARALTTISPNYVYKCKKAFEDLIELNNNTILPPALITIDHADQQDEQDHQQNVVHYEFSLSLWYDRVKVDVP